MNSVIKEQIMAIRDSGETNMLDYNAVMSIANREGSIDLVCWMLDHKREYGRFIMTGEIPKEDAE